MTFTELYTQHSCPVEPQLIKQSGVYFITNFLGVQQWQTQDVCGAVVKKKRWDQLYTLGNQGSLRHWKGTLEVLSTIEESKRAFLTCFFGHGGTFELENWKPSSSSLNFRALFRNLPRLLFRATRNQRPLNCHQMFALILLKRRGVLKIPHEIIQTVAALA